MANKQHVARLKQGFVVWNAWRAENDWAPVDLSYAADLSHADLRDADLNKADLTGADLTGANLNKADLSHADLFSANLSHADLRDADLSSANLTDVSLAGANLTDADLSSANLSCANLNKADLTHARLGLTLFAFVDNLSNAIGLDTCRHDGPSSIDHHTLRKTICRLSSCAASACQTS